MSPPPAGVDALSNMPLAYLLRSVMPCGFLCDIRHLSFLYDMSRIATEYNHEIF